ncbi:hypothetical protein B5E87_04115 [Massilimicrobiota sp. An142]|uniref:HAD-IIB family hydrolase n=1 Tax=Massilimicrobiota TaxID=1924110 RepID=UPI000B38527B|nr:MULTISPECIES: HAD-IIB family hydrolase [Massilimicrobiota]OUQ14059.1 hypothetical protein B5E87_04115 [Massilimicrobiota sp. An142]
MLQALASDIDRTLFFHERQPQISYEDCEAIQNYQSLGHLFGLCSGRPYQGVVHLFQNLHPDFYIITSGSLILDCDYNVIYKQTIPSSIIHQLYQQYDHQAIIIIHADDFQTYKTKKEFSDDECLLFSDIHEIKYPILGISLVFHDEKIAYQQAQKINHLYPDIEGFQNTDSIDIVPKGCSKGTALQKIKDYYQITNLAGIGDSYNDIPMLTNVDIPITFVDAPQTLKDIAQYHVHSVTEAIANLKCYNKIE